VEGAAVVAELATESVGEPQRAQNLGEPSSGALQTGQSIAERVAQVGRYRYGGTESEVGVGGGADSGSDSVSTPSPNPMPVT